jgi:hypothetical protein
MTTQKKQPLVRAGMLPLSRNWSRSDVAGLLWRNRRDWIRMANGYVGRSQFNPYTVITGELA